MSALRHFVNNYRFKKKSEDLKDKECHWDIHKKKVIRTLHKKKNYETFMFLKRNLFKPSLYQKLNLY